MPAETKSENIFLSFHPLHRIAFGLFGAVAIFAVGSMAYIPVLLRILNGWIGFCMIYLALSWIVLFKRSIPEIKKLTRADDGSKMIVFVLILVSSFASMFAVFMLLLAKDQHFKHPALFFTSVVGGMMLSWTMVHTVFTYHYAHMFYSSEKDDYTKIAAGLDFPGKEPPDYIDFAYFSFIIGCTFQVSDVAITSRKIRRIVLLHGLISFALNTFVVALTINLFAGLLN